MGDIVHEYVGHRRLTVQQGQSMKSNLDCALPGLWPVSFSSFRIVLSSNLRWVFNEKLRINRFRGYHRPLSASIWPAVFIRDNDWNVKSNSIVTLLLEVEVEVKLTFTKSLQLEQEERNRVVVATHTKTRRGRIIIRKRRRNRTKRNRKNSRKKEGKKSIFLGFVSSQRVSSWAVTDSRACLFLGGYPLPI